MHHESHPTTFIPRTTETTLLPHTSTHLTLQTTRTQLAHTYAELATHFSKDPDTARTFFLNHATFSFTHPPSFHSDVTYHPIDRAIETALSPMSARRLAYLARTSPDQYILHLDLPQITEHTATNNVTGFRVLDYASQTTEQKIASLERTVESVTYHELLHLLELQHNPNLLTEMTRRRLVFSRIATDYAAFITLIQAAPINPWAKHGLQVLSFIAGTKEIYQQGLFKPHHQQFEARANQGQQLNHAELSKKPFRFTIE